jgi:hypothetical protein
VQLKRVLVFALMFRGLCDPPNIFLEGEVAGGIKLICYLSMSIYKGLGPHGPDAPRL